MYSSGPSNTPMMAVVSATTVSPVNASLRGSSAQAATFTVSAHTSQQGVFAASLILSCGFEALVSNPCIRRQSWAARLALPERPTTLRHSGGTHPHRLMNDAHFTIVRHSDRASPSFEPRVARHELRAGAQPVLEGDVGKTVLCTSTDRG